MPLPWTQDRGTACTKRKTSRIRGSALVAATYLLLASLILLMLYLITFTRTGARFNKQFRATMCGTTTNDETSKASKPSAGRMTFQQIGQLENFSYANDEAWSTAALTRLGEGPSVTGHVWVKYNETLNMAWGVSMFHALHCLKMLRSGIQAGPFAEMLGVGDASGHSSKSHHSGHFDGDHLGHCVSYIAQYLLCAGDSTIEPPWVRHDSDGNVVNTGIDGMGYQHQCRDSTFLSKTIAQSEQSPVQPWPWEFGDTVESVFDSNYGKRISI